MAESEGEDGGDHELDEEEQELTADVMEAVAWLESLCGRGI